jgi:ATPase subunit of ABC transporter with duplicated ATPase domains
MANILNLDRVSKGYPVGQLLSEVSLGLDEADRVGVVGLNGAGKTTLLRLMTKAEEPDSGRVTQRRDLRIGYLEQARELPAEATVRDVVVGSAQVHEWASDSGVRAVLSGLGLPRLGLDAVVGPMSGGERRRIALAALLVRPTDMLVLDEPTNHLDVAGIAWLAGHLAGRKGALVVVTHDRWFLDAVCTATWEVADGTVHAYPGGYAAWTLARAERARLASAAEARRQNLLRKEIAWLRRGPPARTSKPRFRIEAANALIADEPPARDRVNLRRLASARLGRQVYEVDGASVHFGERTVLDGIDWLVGPGDRIGIVGANGTGKTTLLGLLAGTGTPDKGRVVRGATVRAALLSQELAELPDGLRVLEAVEEIGTRIAVGGADRSAAHLAEDFGFSGSRLWTPVGELSGGERRRLQLLRLLAAGPNVLLLDEPTNDLDIDTLAGFEDLLDGWPGTVIVASHDRYFVERVCDTVYGMFGDGRLVHLPGGVEEYLARSAPGPAPSGPTSAAGRDDRSGSGRGAGHAEPESSKDGASKALGPARAKASARGAASARNKELARLERQLSRLEQREATLHDELANHATDYEKVVALDAELRAVRAERSGIEDAWLGLAELLPSEQSGQ